MLYGFSREDIQACTAGYTEMENASAAQKLLTGLKLFQVSRRGDALYCSPDRFTFSMVTPYAIPLEWLGNLDWRAELEQYRQTTGTDLTELLHAEGDQFHMDIPELFHCLIREGTSTVVMDQWEATEDGRVEFGITLRRISRKPGLEDLTAAWDNDGHQFRWLAEEGSLLEREITRFLGKRLCEGSCGAEGTCPVYGYCTLQNACLMEDTAAAAELFRGLGVEVFTDEDGYYLSMEGGYCFHSQRTRHFDTETEEEAASEDSEKTSQPCRHPGYLLMEGNRILPFSSPHYIAEEQPKVTAFLEAYRKRTGTNLSDLVTFRFGLACLDMREILRRTIRPGEFAISVGHDINNDGEIRGASAGRISGRKGMSDLFFTFEDLAALLNRGDPRLDREIREYFPWNHSDGQC